MGASESAPAPTALAQLAVAGGEASLAPDALKACCASAYAHPAVRWVLGGELHPGGAATTRRALELAGLRAGERLLDVASGDGASALLAADELGATVTGIEYGESAVTAATKAAAERGLTERVTFLHGDAEALPLPDASADVVLCECSLCTFPDKPAAVREMRRVLRPGGRLALADVVRSHDPLPDPLRGALATIACIGEAQSDEGYRELLEAAGLHVRHAERVQHATERFAARIEERLRGARLLGIGRDPDAPLPVEAMLTAVRQAREAIAEGALGYAILIASAPELQPR